MFRRWKWFRRRGRSTSAQRAAAASALRDDRIVREALDDYVRDVFSPAAAAASEAASASRPRCSVRRLPLDATPRTWNLDDHLLYCGRRRSYTVLYLRTSPTDSSKSAQPDPETGELPPEPAAAFSCDCSEQSSCPHASTSGRSATEQLTAGDRATSRAQMVDATTQAPTPRKPFTPWKTQKETTEESRAADEKAKNKEEVSGGEQKDEAATEAPKQRKPFTPWKEQKKTTEESRAVSERAIQVDRSEFLLSKSSQTHPPTVHVTLEEPAEEPIAASAAGTSVLSDSVQVEADTQTEDQPFQQTVVRLLPGPSGLPTIVIESTGNWMSASQSGPRSADVGVQVRAEQLVAAAGEAARLGRTAERKSKLAVDRQSARARPSRPRLDIPRTGRSGGPQPQPQMAPRHAEEAPTLKPTPAPAPARDDGNRSPGSLRWSEWDDKQPWAAAEKYTIRNTNEESVPPNDSTPMPSASTLYFNRRIAEESRRQHAAPPDGAPRLVLREPPAAPAAPGGRESVATAGAASPPSSPPGRVQRRRPSTVAAPATPTLAPPATPPPTPPGFPRPEIKRHDCTGQLQDPTNSASQPPR